MLGLSEVTPLVSNFLFLLFLFFIVQEKLSDTTMQQIKLICKKKDIPLKSSLGPKMKDRAGSFIRS